MKCGYEYYRISQHWFYYKFKGADDNMLKYAKHLGIPQNILKTGEHGLLILQNQQILKDYH